MDYQKIKTLFDSSFLISYKLSFYILAFISVLVALQFCRLLSAAGLKSFNYGTYIVYSLLPSTVENFVSKTADGS